MADNVTLNTGVGGSVVATDDDGAAQHQYVKVEFGPDNTQTKVELTEGMPVQGDTAHGDATSGQGQILPIGVEGEDYGTTPGLVNDNDFTRPLADTQGIQFVIGGAPHVITREIAHGTGQAADENMAAAVVGAAEVCVVTQATFTCDARNTGAIGFRMGFGAATVPAASASGVSGMIASHPGVIGGGGITIGDGSGIIAVGAAGEEPRIDTDAAASTAVTSQITYYIVDQT